MSWRDNLSSRSGSLGITKAIIILSTCAVLVLLALVVHAEESGVLFREDFLGLEDWEPIHFRKIKEHTKYRIEKSGDDVYLLASSNASASALAYIREFDVYKYPKVKWSWKITDVYEKGNAGEKSGDDYPMRVYVMFKYVPEGAPFADRIKYGLYRKLYGEYPPASSLNYIWASRQHNNRVIESPYTERSRMIVLRWGIDNAGKWVREEVDIVGDYRRAFGKDPPETARIAVMNDSDNTGEASVSYMDYIEVSE
jgi:hypothetical protein